MITYIYGVYNSETRQYDYKTEILGVGSTLAVGTRTAQIMSDIWDTETFATYWDPEAGRIMTRGLYYHNEGHAEDRRSTAVVDATPEVLEAVKAYLIQEEYARAKARAEDRAREVSAEKIVRVVRGRNAVGTVGKVFRLISASYNAGWRSTVRTKAGIALNDETVMKVVGNKTYKNYKNVVWVWAHNVEVVDPKLDMTEEELMLGATGYAEAQLKQLLQNGKRR